MATHTQPTPDELSTRLFVIVVVGTLAFFSAMGLVFLFMKA